MHLSHRIRLHPSDEQRRYFERACGTARFVWNWALAEWNRQYEAGGRPTAKKLKKQFNAMKYDAYPWLKDVHRDSHAQPFLNLGKAWAEYFEDLAAFKAKKLQDRPHPPRLKKKRKWEPSFYVANDKFHLDEQWIRLPKVGRVKMAELLRFQGKIVSATVSRTADWWFVAIQVDVPDAYAKCERVRDGIVGVDLGLHAAATLSTGERVLAPKPLRAALRRVRIRSRRVSRKVEAAKRAMGIAARAPIPKGTRLPASNNRRKSSRGLARLHARVANVRGDFLHKLTTRLCRENQAIVIEDLNVKGMLANERLARAISDVGFGRFRRQLQYKVQRYDTRLVIADRWYPSSRLCSSCGWKNENLTLAERIWTCQRCGAEHDRDLNAALNLERLATETALPVASSSGNGEHGEADTLSRRRESDVCQVRGRSVRRLGAEKEAHFCAPSG